KEIKSIVSNAVQTFEEMGAHVEKVNLGIKRNQRELSDLWCRIVILSRIEKFEGFKKEGLDFLKNIREDLPPELIGWLEKGYNLNVQDIIKDQQIRTEIYDAIQNIYKNYDLLIT